MKILKTKFQDILLLEPQVYADSRGQFCEVWNKKTFVQLGIACDFVQDNVSKSAKGTLRGLHYQLHSPQGKLVSVSYGKAFDVVLDMRKGSKTFGKWEAFILSDTNNRMLWIPPGFAHGFYTLSDTLLCHYKCTSYYNKKSERCILWSDNELDIKWPRELVKDLIVSDKDSNGVRFSDAEYLL